MWFRRRDMGYAKRKKIWAHEEPSTKEKNVEHMKAHVLKKKRKKIVMFQNNKLWRDHIYKRSIVLVSLFPHTCTS